MNKSLSRRITVRSTLFAIGWLGIFMGMGISLYACFILRPKVSAVTDELQRGAAGARALAATAQETAAVIPDGLQRLKTVLLEVSRTTKAGGEAAKDTTEGVTGIVAPKEALKASSVSLKQTGNGMKRLAATVAQLSSESRMLVTESGGLLDQVLERSEGLYRAMHYAELPLQTMFLGLALGGLYFFIGVICLIIRETLDDRGGWLYRETGRIIPA